MVDDIFSVIDDWFGDNQGLTVDDYKISEFDHSDNFHFDNNSKFENHEQSPLDYNSFQMLEIAHNFLERSDYLNLESHGDISQFHGVGNPLEDAKFWQEQAGSSSCAIVAQMGVYQSITGIELPEDAVCKIAEINGWFDPNSGTSPDALGKILNVFGVTIKNQYDASLNEIAQALEKGDKVIVALDAHEIWNPLRDGDGKPIEQEDGGHAVWVTGMDQDADGNIKIILNDSGISDGRMKVVDAADFVNAWDDFGNHLVIAKNTNPSAIV